MKTFSYHKKLGKKGKLVKWQRCFLYRSANKLAMHQPKVVHYIATVYTMYLFQRSFARLSRIKIPTVFSEDAMYSHMYVLSFLIYRRNV